MQNQSNNELDRLAEELTLRRELDKFGNIYYYNEQDQFHRVHGPAVIYTDGTEYWYQNDEKHRLDGPAVIHFGSIKFWYINGVQYDIVRFNIHPLVVRHKIKTMLQRINAALRSKYVSRDCVK